MVIIYKYIVYSAHSTHIIVGNNIKNWIVSQENSNVS